MLPLHLGAPAGVPLSVLAIGAHPDDIEIGAGGLLLALAQGRPNVRYVVLTGTVRRLGPVIRRALLVRQPLKRLTRRQLEVLRLVSEGKTTRQMAERLKVSAKTVETTSRRSPNSSP